MAKKIIILERVNEPSDQAFNYVFWLTVPVNKQSLFADVNKKSLYKDATQQELDNIKNGVIHEVSGFVVKKEGQGSMAEVKQELIARYNDEQSILNNIKKWSKYGTYYDGTDWTAGGI